MSRNALTINKFTAIYYSYASDDRALINPQKIVFWDIQVCHCLNTSLGINGIVWNVMRTNHHRWKCRDDIGGGLYFSRIKALVYCLQKLVVLLWHRDTFHTGGEALKIALSKCISRWELGERALYSKIMGDICYSFNVLQALLNIMII